MQNLPQNHISTLDEARELVKLAVRTVGIEKFQETTIDRYSKLYGQALLILECLSFFQKAVDFFNRIVYNKIVRYLSLYKSSLTEENIYG